MTRYEFYGYVYYNGQQLNLMYLEYSDEISKDISRSEAFFNLMAYLRVKYDLPEEAMIFLTGDFYYQVGDNDTERYDAWQECLPVTLCKMAYESKEKWIWTDAQIPEMAYYKKFLRRPFTTKKFLKVVTGKYQERVAFTVCLVVFLIIIGVAASSYIKSSLPDPDEVAEGYSNYMAYQSEKSAYEAMADENGNIEIMPGETIGDIVQSSEG